MNTFLRHYKFLAEALLQQEPFHTGEWHAQDTSQSSAHATYELIGVQAKFMVPVSKPVLALCVEPNLPWADLHFDERVSGEPLNPPPSHVQWPWASHNARHQDLKQQFSHTYPERYWPRWAGYDPPFLGVQSEVGRNSIQRRGIRYRFGDLNDVVELLIRSPLTRQAYLPVWFPEDTGNVSNVRVPCSLGYHFMIRNDKLHCWYAMRSCDFVRHYRDDVYLTARLVQWIRDKLNEHRPEHEPIEAGSLHLTVSSLHAFVGDTHTLQTIAEHP